MLSFDDSEICRSILESLPTGLCVLDMQKKIVLWSDGAERISGHLRHEVVGHSCVSEPLLHCDHPGCEFCSEDCAAFHAMKTSRPAQSFGFLHHRAGHEVPVRLHAVPVHNRRGSIIGAVEIFSEIQQTASSERGDSLRHYPESVDPITGVANRPAMQSHLKHALVSRLEVHISFSLLLLRVEGLTHFRASLGAEAASSFLRVIARSLENTLWATDCIGRWTEDQFLVILSGCTEEALPGVRERIRHVLAGEGIEWWGERRSLPISIGEAVPEPEDNVDSLLTRAQKSLDLASAWRNQACTATPAEARS